MKTRILVLISAIIAVSGQLLYSQGSQYLTGDVIRIASSDTLQRQLIAAGEWIEIAGTISNDLYAAGSSVTVDGTIGDDAFIAGNQVSVKGTIEDMLVSAAGTLLLDGNVNGDLFAAGRDIRFTENSRISGNAFLAGQDIRITSAAEITGSTRMAGRSVSLEGRFGGDVHIYSNDVRFGPGYDPSGNTRIISSKEIDRENLGVIPDRLTIDVQRPPYLPVIMFQVWYYLGLLVIGSVLLLLFRPVAEDMQRFSAERFWKNTGIGLLVFLLVPLALFLLLFPVITIPLAVLSGVLYILTLFFSYLMVALIIGMQFVLWFRKEPRPAAWFGALALGLILIALINNLPLIGPVISLFLLFFGVGSFTSYLVIKYRQKGTSHA